MANLMITSSNDQPKRQESYPQTWLLYTENNTVEIEVEHDIHNQPRVVDKHAA